MAYRDRKGYGSVTVGPRVGGNKKLKAHRVAFAIAHDDLPDLLVCHKCDNPPCCNPAHLFAGTNADNMRDMFAKGLRVQPRGVASTSAKLSEAQVREIRSLLPSVGPRELGRRYGVSNGLIRFIGTGERWGHLK